MEIIGIVAGISGEVIVKELKKKGFKTLVISGRDNDSGMEISDFKLVSDLKKHEEILKNLRTIGVSKIILGTGHVLAFELAKYLKANGVKISVNPEKSLIAKDKYLYKKELEEKGFLTPKYLELECTEIEKSVLETKIKKIGIPCVIKSTIDTMYPQKANTLEEALHCIEAIFKTNSPVLIEQFIDGIDTTVPVYSNKNETKAIMVSYYSKAKECHLKGFEICGKIEKLPKEIEVKLLRYSENVTKAMGTIGMTRLDIIVDKDYNFYILECNSVMVTGVHPNQIEYGREFLERENINFAELTVNNALIIFEME